MNIQIDDAIYAPAPPLMEEFIKTKYRTLFVNAIKKHAAVVGNSGIVIRRINNVVFINNGSVKVYIPLS